MLDTSRACHTSRSFVTVEDLITAHSHYATRKVASFESRPFGRVALYHHTTRSCRHNLCVLSSKWRTKLNQMLLWEMLVSLKTLETEKAGENHVNAMKRPSRTSTI